MKRTILLLVIIVILRFAIPFIKGFIQGLKSSEENEENEKSTDNSFSPDTCIEIAKIISHHDGKVIKEMEEMIADPISYYCDDDLSEFEKKWIREQKIDDETIWIGMAMCLARNNYVCELDWKGELVDFIGSMNNLNYDTKFDQEVLDEDGDVSQWCEELDKTLQAENKCIGCIDIGSDSYVMFICEKSVLEHLRELARSIGHTITYASQM